MKSRIAFIESMRIYATFAVVLLHVSAAILISNRETIDLVWWVANIADSFSRWCVPIFVMITGRLLLSKEPILTPVAFFKKALFRITPALAFWTITYIVFTNLTQREQSSDEFIGSIVKGKPYYHLWYIYMLLGLYAATPLIQRFNTQFVSKNPALWISLFFLIGAFDQLIIGHDSTFITTFIPFIAFFLAGHYIEPNFIGSNIYLKLALVFIFGALIALATGLSFPYIGRAAYSIWYAYLNPLVIAMSLIVFSLLMDPTFRIKSFIVYRQYHSEFILFIHYFWILLPNWEFLDSRTTR